MLKPIKVPLVRQSHEYSCGAASLASCLYYWGVWSGRETELYPIIGTSRDGTRGNGIIRGAKHFGLDVVYKDRLSINDLSKLIADGYTAILDIQAWGSYTSETDFEKVWNDGHYVVLVNVINDQVILMDPAVPGRYTSISKSRLEERWHDWNDTGSKKEYHGAILIKGKRSIDSLSEYYEIE